MPSAQPTANRDVRSKAPFKRREISDVSQLASGNTSSGVRTRRSASARGDPPDAPDADLDAGTHQRLHPRSCIAATMTTIWRPHPLNEPVIPVKEEVPDDDVLDVKVKPPADDDPADDDDEKKTDLEGKEPDVLVCPITPEAEPDPVLALGAQPRKSKKRTRGKPSEAARARKNARKNKRKRARLDGGVRPDGTPRPTRNDRKKKTKTRREAEARAAVRAVVSHRTSVPAEIGQLTSLRELDLRRNELTSVPAANASS